MKYYALILTLLVLAGCDSQQQREARYLQRGQDYFDHGQYDKARLEYRNAARIAPVDPVAAYRLGLTDEALLNIGGAYGDFLHAVELDKTFQPALLKLANYDLAGGQPEQAQAYVDAVLALARDQPEARALNGALLLRKQDYANAQSEARFALQKEPGNITAYSVLTGLYLATKDTTKAQATIAEGVGKNPGDLSLLLLQAKVAEQVGDFTTVESAYQRLFTLRPDFIQLRLDLAAVYTAANRLDDAEKTLRQAVAAKPDDMGLRHALVIFLGDHRGMESAELEIQAAMKAYPKNDDFYFWLADLYTAHQATDKAILLLQQVVAQNQSSAVGLTARTSLARIDLLRGNKALAQQLVDTVLAKQTGNRDALFVRANLSDDNGNYQDAVSDLRTIIHDAPADNAAQKLLAETFLRQGYLNLAIETLRQLTESDAGDLAARVRLAQMYDIQGNHATALEITNAVAKSDPTYPVAWETMARLAIKTGNFDLARDAIGHLAAIDGQQETATFLQGQLAARQGDAQGATALYAKVIAADPAAPLAEHSSEALAETYMRQGKIAEATATLDDAINHGGDDPQPYLDRAQIYLAQHKPDEALAVLAKAETAMPGDLRASMMHADIANSLGRYQEATKLYETILARSPGMDVAANNFAAMIADYQYNDPAALARAYDLTRKFGTARQPELLDTLAWIYYRQNDTEQALATIARAAKLAPGLSPEMEYHYGAILLKSGRKDEAQAHLAKALAGEMQYPGRDDAKALLDK